LGIVPAMPATESLYTLLFEESRLAGFVLCGALDLGRARAALDEQLLRYDQWLARGYCGEMEYLRSGRDRRADPRRVFPAARSVLSVAWPHDPRPLGSEDPARGPRFARYLRGADYHSLLASRLEGGLARASERWTALGKPPLRWKVAVDTSAVLERGLAALAGLGWIGRNGMLIHPKWGSYLLLAEAFLDQETGRSPEPGVSLCGRCKRCVGGCPTRALFEEDGRWVLDSRRCTAYRTLEAKAEESTELDLEQGPWVAGCDL
jgi:epoxyqueuosine reductase